MNTKNRGFSLLISIVASLILTGVSIGIIASVNRTLDQVNNIARSNQIFFAAESAREAAFFHHGVRGAGLVLGSGSFPIDHPNVGASASWSIAGREQGIGGSTTIVEGKVRENEKITIPLYWDSSTEVDDDFTEINMHQDVRRRLRLKFSDQDPFDNTNNSTFDFGTASQDEVLFIWSVTRMHDTDGAQVFIPITPTPGEPCAAGSLFYCKSDFSGFGTQHFTSSGTIATSRSQIEGIILPGNIPTNIWSFMRTSNSSKYEISFRPVLPFKDTNDIKISTISFRIESLDPEIAIPTNIYELQTVVDFPNFRKETTKTYKEKTKIGAFDYIIFK